MKPAALGFRVHSGWTSLVAIALEENVPVVLARQRPHLVEAFTYTFRQPYHTAERMPLGDARPFIERVRVEAERLAVQAICSATSDADQQGYKVKRCELLLASGRELPELERILASHAMIHTADGELFRHALRHAAAQCKLKMTAIRERELWPRASTALHTRTPVLAARITKLGRTVGSPWSQDEKLATLAACVALKD
jgi:hypothetical protein